MRKEFIYLLLSIVIALTLAIRLYFAFSTPYFSDDTSYYQLRQVEAIQQHFVPEFYDPLSFGGRLFLFSPLFHYLLAFLTSFGSNWYLTKIIPNVFAVSIVPIIFLLVDEITKNKQIALFTACVSAFIPIYFVETVNSLSVKSLSLPLSFLFLLFFYKIQNRTAALWCLFLLCFLILLDASSLLLLFGLLVYLFLEKIYGITPKKEHLEFVFFGLLLSAWFYFLLYKSALLQHGMNILWQNIPQQLVDKYYYNITIIGAIYHIGIVPLFFGLLVIYYILFYNPKKEALSFEQEAKNYEDIRRKIFPIISITLVITVLLWLTMVEWTLGLLYLSILLVILSGYGYMLFHNYLQRTKIKKWSGIIFGVVFLIFILSSVIPAFTYTDVRIAQTITPKEILFLTVLPQITSKNEIVLSLVDDGHYIEYFAGRKTVADSNFLQIPDAKQRLQDIETVFTTHSKIVATKIMNKYHATYIYVSPTAKELYNIEYLPYEDNDCIQLIYTGVVRLYKSTCEEDKT